MQKCAFCNDVSVYYIVLRAQSYTINVNQFIYVIKFNKMYTTGQRGIWQKHEGCVKVDGVTKHCEKEIPKESLDVAGGRSVATHPRKDKNQITESERFVINNMLIMNLSDSFS